MNLDPSQSQSFGYCSSLTVPVCYYVASCDMVLRCWSLVCNSLHLTLLSGSEGIPAIWMWSVDPVQHVGG